MKYIKIDYDTHKPFWRHTKTYNGDSILIGISINYSYIINSFQKFISDIKRKKLHINFT